VSTWDSDGVYDPNFIVFHDLDDPGFAFVLNSHSAQFGLPIIVDALLFTETLSIPQSISIPPDSPPNQGPNRNVLGICVEQAKVLARIPSP
jgi:hypothetical protein